MKTNKRLVVMVCAAAILLFLSVSGILWLVFGASEEEKVTNAMTAENISVSSDSAENDTDTDSSEAATAQPVSESDSSDSRTAEEINSPKGGMQVSDPDGGTGAGSVSVTDNISFSELTDTESGSSTPQASGGTGSINDTNTKNETENPAPPVQETPEPGNDPAEDEASDQNQELRFGVLE